MPVTVYPKRTYVIVDGKLTGIDQGMPNIAGLVKAGILTPAEGLTAQAPPPQVVQPPGLLKKIGNFTKAAAQHVAHGMPKVSNEVQQFRLSLCVVCKPWYDAKTGVCLHPDCGCRLAKKTSWALQKCPIGKW